MQEVSARSAARAHQTNRDADHRQFSYTARHWKESCIVVYVSNGPVRSIAGGACVFDLESDVALLLSHVDPRCTAQFNAGPCSICQ